MRELEKQLPKATGVISQSVKDVVQSLVDDRLVTCEKIGASNFFWSFPSTALQQRENTKRTLTDEIDRLQESRGKMERQTEEALATRQETEERMQLLAKMGELEAMRTTAMGKLEMHRANDPKLFAAKKEATAMAKAAANRWTDNIFLLQSYCANNFSLARSDFNAQFSIPEDLDNIE